MINMKTISLRFTEKFAPNCGTIKAHQDIINKLGYVWYGKIGGSISDKTTKQFDLNGDFKILLIESGKFNRYWAYVSEISKTKPSKDAYPDYYGELADKMKTWFKITKIVPAPKDIMKRCFVISSGRVLSDASKCSMNPCLFIECKDD